MSRKLKIKKIKGISFSTLEAQRILKEVDNLLFFRVFDEYDEALIEYRKHPKCHESILFLLKMSIVKQNLSS